MYLILYHHCTLVSPCCHCRPGDMLAEVFEDVAEVFEDQPWPVAKALPVRLCHSALQHAAGALECVGCSALRMRFAID